MFSYFTFQIGPKKTLKIFQIFNLIRKSVEIFGQKLTVGEQKQVQLQGGKSHNNAHFCRHQGLILVKFAKLTLPYEPMANTTIKR